MVQALGKRQKTGGRQAGTPNKQAKFDLMQAAKLYSLRALATIVDVMEDEEEPGSTRIQAANLVLERAYGKAKQIHEVGGLDGDDIQTRLTIEFVGQIPQAQAIAQSVTDQSGDVIEQQMKTVQVPVFQRPWEK